MKNQFRNLKKKKNSLNGVLFSLSYYPTLKKESKKYYYYFNKFIKLCFLPSVKRNCEFSIIEFGAHAELMYSNVIFFGKIFMTIVKLGVILKINIQYVHKRRGFFKTIFTFILIQLLSNFTEN